MTLKIGIAGSLGRMGRLLTREVLEKSPEVSLSCASARNIKELKSFLPNDCDAVLTDSPKTLVMESDVIIDFTVPELSLRHAYYATELNKRLVIGTTGFSDEHYQKLSKAGQSTALLVTSNTSLGITVLGSIAPLVKQALGPDFDIEIRDVHHRDKKDAPSGTALTLASKLSSDDPASLRNHQDLTLPCRNKSEIGISVTRAGGIIGDHEISFVSKNEIITLSHRSLDRRLFASGALKAAQWIASQKPGLYSMEDVLLKNP